MRGNPTPVEIAQRYRFATQMVTTGRGYAYPTAREAALKLMETSYLAALAFSGADLLHGPLALADPDVPVPSERSWLRVPTPAVDERYAPLLDILACSAWPWPWRWPGGTTRMLREGCKRSPQPASCVTPWLRVYSA